MEKHGTTVYLPPRNLAVDAVLYGPDLESHYKLCIHQFATDKLDRPTLKARPDIQAEIRCLSDALERVRADQAEPPEGAGLAAEAGCPVTPGKSPTVGLVGPFVRLA